MNTLVMGHVCYGSGGRSFTLAEKKAGVCSEQVWREGLSEVLTDRPRDQKMWQYQGTWERTEGRKKKIKFTSVNINTSYIWSSSCSVEHRYIKHKINLERDIQGRSTCFSQLPSVKYKSQSGKSPEWLTAPTPGCLAPSCNSCNPVLISWLLDPWPRWSDLIFFWTCEHPGKPKPQYVMTPIFILVFLFQKRNFQGMLPSEEQFYGKCSKLVQGEELGRRLVREQLVVQCVPLDLILNQLVFDPGKNKPNIRFNLESEAVANSMMF